MNRRRFAATMLQGLASAGLIGVIGGPGQGKPALATGHEQESPCMYKTLDDENTGYNPVKPIPSRRGRRFADYNYHEKNFNRLRR